MYTSPWAVIRLCQLAGRIDCGSRPAVTNGPGDYGRFFWIVLTLAGIGCFTDFYARLRAQPLPCVCWLLSGDRFHGVEKLNWRYASIVSAVVAGLFAVGTLQRLPVWHDDLTLYAATLTKHPDASIVRMNLATELARRGQLTEAIGQLDIVLKLNPSDASVLSNKAALKSRQGDWQAASEICSKVLTVDANMLPCITLSAAADQQRGEVAAALQKLDRAISVSPRSYEAHYYRGNVYSQMGRLMPQSPIRTGSRDATHCRNSEQSWKHVLSNQTARRGDRVLSGSTPTGPRLQPREGEP
jgi:tetratricopeptide (TPR) repeat protein